MQEIIESLTLFFQKHGLTIIDLDFKFTIKGQIENCTGNVNYELIPFEMDVLIKRYNKTLVCSHYSFFNTELKIDGNTFNIVKRK